MATYVILRRSGWSSPEELQQAAERSTAEGEKMADDLRWIRSYVLEEGGGSVGTVCIYQASSPEAIRRHAGAADLPVDEIVKVADTVVVRDEPCRSDDVAARFSTALAFAGLIAPFSSPLACLPTADRTACWPDAPADLMALAPSCRPRGYAETSRVGRGVHVSCDGVGISRRLSARWSGRQAFLATASSSAGFAPAVWVRCGHWRG